jgi:ABC-type glycerol-3-phosphate transport system permease component
MKKKVIYILKQLVCIILSIIVITPFYMVFVNSLKTKNEAARMNLSLPREWLFSNYLVVIREGNLIQGFSNSFLYAFLSATIAVVTCAMAAFVLNREKSKLNRMIYYFILCGFFFPVNFVTLMKIFNTIGIANTRFGLIIANILINSLNWIIKNDSCQYIDNNKRHYCHNSPPRGNVHYFACLCNQFFYFLHFRPPIKNPYSSK